MDNEKAEKLNGTGERSAGRFNGQEIGKVLGRQRVGTARRTVKVGRDLRDYRVQIPVQNLLKYFIQMAIQPI